MSAQTSYSTVKASVKINQSLLYIPKFVDDVKGFGFFVIHDIVVRRVGILKSSFKGFQSEIKLVLKSSFDGSQLATAIFSPKLFYDCEEKFIMKTIPAVHLPKGFEAFLALEFLKNEVSFLENCGDFQWDEGPGVLKFIHLRTEPKSKPWAFINDSCPHIFMDYTIYGEFEFQNNKPKKTTNNEFP